jgi:hypothetical protein
MLQKFDVTILLGRIVVLVISFGIVASTQKAAVSSGNARVVRVMGRQQPLRPWC